MRLTKKQLAKAVKMKKVEAPATPASCTLTSWLPQPEGVATRRRYTLRQAIEWLLTDLITTECAALDLPVVAVEMAVSPEKIRARIEYHEPAGECCAEGGRR